RSSRRAKNPTTTTDLAGTLASLLTVERPNLRPPCARSKLRYAMSEMDSTLSRVGGVAGRMLRSIVDTPDREQGVMRLSIHTAGDPNRGGRRVGTELRGASPQERG